MEVITNNSYETESVAEKFATHLRVGDVVLMRGEMGVGKTVFTKGLCRGLCVSDYVTSPTFTVVNEYEGKDFKVYHFDLYRIEEEDELFEIGFEEYLSSGGVCIIEWPQNAEGCMPKTRYEVEILRQPDDENRRKIVIKKVQL